MLWWKFDEDKATKTRITDENEEKERIVHPLSRNFMRKMMK